MEIDFIPKHYQFSYDFFSESTTKPFKASGDLAVAGEIRKLILWLYFRV